MQDTSHVSVVVTIFVIISVQNQVFILRSYCYLTDPSYNTQWIPSKLHSKIIDNRAGQPTVREQFMTQQ